MHSFNFVVMEGVIKNILNRILSWKYKLIVSN